jgi:Ca-activated chloride channel homolog
MHWGLPVYLNFLLIVPALMIFFFFTSAMKRKSLERFGDRAIVGKLCVSKSVTKEKSGKMLITAAAVFLIIALARPQIGTTLTMTKRSGVDILAAIDTSESMLGRDIMPDRMEKAKMEVSLLIDRLKGDRVGILTFAGDSFVQCPLTLDYGAAKMFLGIVESGMMPRPGTAIGGAIRTALKSFIKKERKYKVLVLLTDGEDHDSDPIGAANEAKKQGVVIYTVGIGTPKGEPIPVLDANGNVAGYKKDRRGEVVMSKLDEAALQKIALLTGGKYYRAASSGFELDKIYDEINGMEKKELSSRLFTRYEDRFQYFLGIALILLCAAFVIGDRKRI